MSWLGNHLEPKTTPGARVQELSPNEWRLTIPAGSARRYRLAQLDDYAGLPRRRFPWRPPVQLHLLARASDSQIQGTWGFGLWNDPFGAGFLAGGSGVRLPVLPNSCWFFFASPPNSLSLRDDIPAFGALAATFQGGRYPALFIIPGAFALPFLAFRSTARLLRRFGRRILHQDAAALTLDPREWHEYCLEWHRDSVLFRVDGEMVLLTEVSPFGPLGLVIWIDNQFAAFPADGRLRYGILRTCEGGWIEISQLSLSTLGADGSKK